MDSANDDTGTGVHADTRAGMRPPSRGLMGSLVAVAAAIVILAASVLPFLTPAWVGFEQGRAESAARTGYAPEVLQAVTNSILADLVLGPGRFDVLMNGTPVLTDAERGHMRDVRGVFAGFGILALAALGLLFLVARRARDPESRAWAWASVRRGARGLAVGLAVAGILALVAFDAAFELFHRLFFAQGTYSFDPSTSRLVQLFPDSFWSETTLAVGAIAILAALSVAWLAGWRMAAAPPSKEPERHPIGESLVPGSPR
jgi:integral membrane protein (TIGR01906 family)